MNLLYLHSHDTGRWLSPYGFPVETPNLMNLARSGCTFRNAHCVAPTCSPSRAALLTGQWAHQSGMLGLAHLGWRLNHPNRHLANVLAQNGRTTALCGIQHLTDRDGVSGLGYDEYLQPAQWSSSGIAERAATWLKERPKNAPWFLDVGFFETHRTFPAFNAARSDAENPDRALIPPGLPDQTRVRDDIAAFAASARALDEAIGTILRALEDAGLRENTLVIYTTDHGPAFPGMKCTLSDAGTGVALLMSGPNVAANSVSDAMVSHIDVFPTLCDYLEIEKPKWLEGRSFAPLLRGEEGDGRDELFSEVTFHAAFEPQRAIRTRRWKYIRRFGERRLPVLPNLDASPSRDVWTDAGWHERPLPAEALYDLKLDPQERDNLALDPVFADTRDELKTRLEEWMRETNDPLIDPDFRVPPGVQSADTGAPNYSQMHPVAPVSLLDLMASP